MKQTTDGGYIIAGYTAPWREQKAGTIDARFLAWAIKTDPKGNEQWNRTYKTRGFYEWEFYEEDLTRFSKPQMGDLYLQDGQNGIQIARKTHGLSRLMRTEMNSGTEHL